MKSAEKIRQDSIRVLELVEYLEKNYDCKDDKNRMIENSVFKEFQDLPVSIIGELLDPVTRTDNLEIAVDMYENLYKIASGGKNKDDFEKEFADKLFKKFVDPKYGGRDNLIKKIQENNKDNNK